ncbi:MAG: RusA family crossover junction endodeoxyribonuclease [Acidobacteria bacterium]|nr:RusA family crossover junction endodeoxyribonuclease [Acidobacteriota bacterium]
MLNSESDFTIKRGVVRFHTEARSFCATAKGRIINPQTQPSLRVQDWKDKVECAVKAARGGAQWSCADRYAVTLQFRFGFGPGCFRSKDQKLDVDNFVKPVVDGLAKGLGVDDSNFRILLIRRLDDVETLAEEGVRLFVSSTGNAPPG